MFKEFTREEWAKKLEPLSKFHRAAFSAACAERLFEHYAMFHRENNWGDPVLARESLNKVWEWALTESFSESDVAKLLEELEDVTPDDENFGDFLSSYGQNAIFCVWYSLQSLISEEVMHAVHAAEAVIDTVYMYLRYLFDKKHNLLDLSAYKEIDMSAYYEELDKSIYADPFMIKELQRQEEDIDLLKYQPVLTHEIIEKLRKSALENRIVIDQWPI